jgi:hypothetical protein
MRESAGALVETKVGSIHTGNACEEDEWDDHHREPAAPDNPGSPNDNRVAYNKLKRYGFLVHVLEASNRLWRTLIAWQMICAVASCP